MQAARPVSAFGSVLTGVAQVAFFDQPDLGVDKLSALDGVLDDFLQDGLH
jgi:hypothetical protein